MARQYYDSYLGKYRKTRKLLVCEECYEAIQSRGECDHGRLLYVDETSEAESKCDWCEENGFNILYLV